MEKQTVLASEWVKKMRESRLKPFLPTSQKIDEMSNFEFEGWIDMAMREIPERKKQEIHFFI